MTPMEPFSILLLTAILVPLLTGVLLLFGARFSNLQFKVLGGIGFGWPLFVGLLLFFQFDASLIGDYNFELRLPTGLEQMGI